MLFAKLFSRDAWEIVFLFFYQTLGIAVLNKTPVADSKKKHEKDSYEAFEWA